MPAPDVMSPNYELKEKLFSPIHYIKPQLTAIAVNQTANDNYLFWIILFTHYSLAVPA